MAELDDGYRKNLEVLVATRTEQLRQSMSDVEMAQNSTLEAYLDALWLKDRATARHSKRVMAFSIALGRAMQLRSNEIRQVARGAFLHDVGKLALADSILSKRTPFTAEEKQIMERHCVWGYEIVKKIGFLSGEAEFIYAHHERWDGRGYPRGLQGDLIPKGARMIAVVNAFDSVCSDQPYRAARPLEQAVREIADKSGTQFDPQVVEAFVSVPESMWRDIVKDVEDRSREFRLI